MPSFDPPEVLIIEDDTDTRRELCTVLETDGYYVEQARSLSEALDRFDTSAFSAVIVGPDTFEGGINLGLPRLKEAAPGAELLLVGRPADHVVPALDKGVDDYVLKPINPAEVRTRLAHLVERKRLASAKARSDAALTSIVELAPCLTVVLRSDRRIMYFNPFAQELTSYTSREAIGKDFVDFLMPSEQRGRGSTQLEHVLAGGVVRGFEVPIVCKDGSHRPTIWNLQRLPGDVGTAMILAIALDITPVKEAQGHALQAERLAAVGEMIAALAHESRNALQEAQASLELLVLKLGPESANLVADVQKAHDRLHRLFDDLRGYAAPIRLEHRACDLAELWHEAWRQLGLLRKGREVWLREVTDETDLHLWADPFRLTQVFRNILGNALTACPDPGQIEIRCSESELDGQPAVRVSFRDNGPGLDPQQAERIFEPFYTTKMQGTGLGMALAKRMVESHGGEIAVGDTDKPGARIVVTLPRGRT